MAARTSRSSARERASFTSKHLNSLLNCPHTHSISHRKPKFLDAYRFIVEALDQRVFLPNRIEEIPGGLLGVNEGFRRQRAHEVRPLNLCDAAKLTEGCLLQISGVKLVYNVLDTPGVSRKQ